MRLTLAETATGSTDLIYDAATQRLRLTRTGSAALSPGDGAADHSAPVAPEAGRVLLRVLVDGPSVEVFACDGTVVMSALVPRNGVADPPRLRELEGIRLERLRVAQITPQANGLPGEASVTTVTTGGPT